jgi:hypothetical protein
VLFEGAGNVLQQSGSLFWDNTNSRLGVGTATPAYALDARTTSGFIVAAFKSQYTATGYIGTDNSAVWIGRGTDGFNSAFVASSNLLLFRANNVQVGEFWSTGNLTIQTGGTYTDAGYKLDVNGTARILGTGTTSATTAFSVQNSSGNNMLRVRDDARVFVGTTTSPFFGAMNRVTTGGEVTGEGFIFNCNGNSTGTDYLFGGSNINASSGTITTFLAQRNFQPSSGTAIHNVLRIASIINQTGGANGITRGLLIEPTLTAAADFRAIEVTAGTTVLAPSVTARASLRIPSGTAPTSPVNGDIWFDGTDIKMRIGGVTKTFTLL